VKTHADFCEAETDHECDCATATELARLRSFAQAVRDEFTCNVDRDHPRTEEHVDDCLHCAAVEALESPR
jgi:hypothetical protein